MKTSTNHARLFNLIIYTQKNKRADYIHRITEHITHKFPSRIIFISVDAASSSDQLNIKTSELQTNGIACDLLEIEVSGATQERVPFIILPHLVSDLPVYLLWAEDLSQENPLSYTLERLTNRLICDSESTDNLPRFAKTLLQRREKSQCDIADLNWARMERVREVLASTFHSEDKLLKLQSTKTIHIRYNALASEFFCHPKIQAIYLQAWLASQMEWEFLEARKDKEMLILTYKNGDKNVSISLEAVSESRLSPGTIVSIDIATAEEERFAFTRDPAIPHQIVLQSSSKEKCGLPYSFIFPKGEAGQSLVKEIFHKGTSSHYLKVLNLIINMDTALLC